MSNMNWKFFLAAPAVLGAALVTSAGVAQASETQVADSSATLSQISQYSSVSSEEAAQVTSVSQLTDVKPTDWAFQALQSLVERYGCIVGYPNKTYRGNQALTRYEFAAGLNACMDRISELINTLKNDYVTKEDLMLLQKLQEEFAAELATLRGRVDGLEVRTATLEKQQFSTTTKLSGEVIFGIADTFGDAATEAGNGRAITTSSTVNGVTTRTPINDDDNTQTIFSYRARLSLLTSFTGSDRLRVRLNANNTTPFSGALTGTNMTRTSFDGSGNNDLTIDKAEYRFNVNPNLKVQINAINTELNSDNMITTLSPFESSGAGAVSRFGRYGSIYRVGNNGNAAGGAGVSAVYSFNKDFRLELGYVSDVGSDGGSNVPTARNGLFNGSYGALAQVVYSGKQLGGALTYARSYFPGRVVDPIDGDVLEPGANLTGSTGSSFAANPFNGAATTSDAFGAQLQYKVSPKFIVGVGGNVMFAHNRNNDDNATVWTAAGYLAFPDLGKRGNLGGIVVGVPPKVSANDFRQNGIRRKDNDTSLHVEAFYRYRINDNIAITPGFYVLFNPEHNSDNATQFVGVLRTTFTF